MAEALRIGWRQYRLERRMFWRNPTAAFFNFLLPLLALGLFGAIAAGNDDYMDILIPGIAGLAIVSTTFVAIAHNLTFLREDGILKRLRGTPMPTGAYIAALAAHAVTNAVIQLAIVVVAGEVVFSIGWPADWAALTAFAAAGVACFAVLGAALAHAIPNADAAPAYVNIAFLPLIMISGVFYDAEDAPGFLHDIAEVLPLTHLVDGLSGAMVDGVARWSDLVVVGVWTAVGAVLAARGFSWDARRG